MNGSGSDLEMWRAYRAATEDRHPPRPVAILLAAYLDGALDEAAAAPVERWLAHDPDAAEEMAILRESVIGLRLESLQVESGQDELPQDGAAQRDVLARVIARAQAIVTPPGVQSEASGTRGSANGAGSLADWFGDLAERFGLHGAPAWVATASLALVIGGLGFELGDNHGDDVLSLLSESGDAGLAVTQASGDRIDFGEPPGDFL